MKSDWKPFQGRIIDDNIVSLSTLVDILKPNQIKMKQLHKVLDMEAPAILDEFMFIDRAGFNQAKTKRRGTNLIGHRATMDIPEHGGRDITKCKCNSGMHKTPRRFFHQCFVLLVMLTRRYGQTRPGCASKILPKYFSCCFFLVYFSAKFSSIFYFSLLFFVSMFLFLLMQIYLLCICCTDLFCKKKICQKSNKKYLKWK